MPFHKVGEFIEISRVENTDSCIPSIDPLILENFKKTANNLRKIAPKAEDFLYFSAVMMHAAEASAINDDGTPKLTIKGEPIQVGWDKRGGTWRWVTNDPSIKPYRNANCDIFPEEELIKAYKKWIHKPLCIDHKSSSVDHTRGFIVDTYYDRNLKRVVALCALDKANYPDLARKVSTGMQTSVSMGTAVTAAICTDCATVAKVEADFCDHMRRKNGYGEINTGLNPIELSIVVNGADPKAHIKHIIAAANTLSSYVDSKEKELKKLADLHFIGNISMSDPLGGEGISSSISVNSNSLEDFKKDLDKAYDNLKQIVEQAKISDKDTNDLVLNQKAGTIAMDETAVPNAQTELAPPVARYASREDMPIVDLKDVIASIESKLNLMKTNLNKLARSNEENMVHKEMSKQGYYQGGGGVNEPTPGQVKYPKDPLNEDDRMEDKHMVGQSPFPGVGDVEGLHPSPSSVDTSDELERKRMLARASAEERQMRRQAAVELAKKALEDRKAYFQNGLESSNVNTPTPGKVKYPKDPLNEDDRMEDKHMVGQKPFPGVGDVKGLHPSPESVDVYDELKRKEMLRRANTLHGKFVRAAKSDGTRDLDNSAWEIRLGDRLLLTASVKDLSGGRSEMMYDAINTSEFGQKLLEKVKVYGADRVSRELVKSAQAQGVPPAPPPAPAQGPSMPAMESGQAPVAEVDSEHDKVVDTGANGDGKESAVQMAEKIRDLASDLVESIRNLTGEQAEMGEEQPMQASASDFSTSYMHTLRKELNASLTQAMREKLAELQKHEEELQMIAGMYDKGTVTASNKDLVETILEDASNEAKTTIAEGFHLLTAFVKYARGTEAIVKEAEINSELQALAEEQPMTHKDDDLMSLIEDTNSDLDHVKELMHSDSEEVPESELEADIRETQGHGMEDDFEGHEEDHEDHEDLGDHEDHEDLGDQSVDLKHDDDNDLMAKPEELKNINVKPGTTVQVTAGFNSKAGRQLLRAKLAAEALGKEDDGELRDMSKERFSDMLEKANKLTDGKIDLDVKPTGDLGDFETLPEANKAILELAKAPPKVRKQAETIQKMIATGELDAKDVDSLVSLGLDKDAVSYWKKFYSQVDGGSEFSSELVKEHAKAKLEKDLNAFKVKMARAYEVTYDMVNRGIIVNDRNIIAANVDELMNFNESNFETLKKTLAKYPVTMNKQASTRIPQVGIVDSGDSHATVAQDDWSLLSAAFAKTPNRLF